MGMAASQSRLLTLTARMTDVEFAAQQIEAKKLALATQKDKLYEDYEAALDATKIVVKYGEPGSYTSVDANYNSVCAYNPNRLQNYAIKSNKTGKLIVTDEIKYAYQEYGNDKFAFAWAMLGFDESFSSTDSNAKMGKDLGVNKSQYNNHDTSTSGTTGNIEKSTLIMTDVENAVYDMMTTEEGNTLENYYKAITKATDTSKAQEAYDTFKELLYSKYSQEIFDKMSAIRAKKDSDYNKDCEWEDISDEFNYYVELWSAIDEAGGCEAIDGQYESGQTGTDWFKAMTEAGYITILEFTYSGCNKGWNEISVTTSTTGNYLQSIKDETNLKKAEAEYEYELSIISSKDSKYDKELSKLETERTAIKAEIDSIKTQRNDNIERTFGIFS